MTPGRMGSTPIGVATFATLANPEKRRIRARGIVHSKITAEEHSRGLRQPSPGWSFRLKPLVFTVRAVSERSVSTLDARSHQRVAPMRCRGLQRGRQRVGRSRRSLYSEPPPQPHQADENPREPSKAKELGDSVRPVIVVNGDLNRAETGELDFRHQLESDRAAVLCEDYAVQDVALDQPEVAVNIVHFELEDHRHQVMVGPADQAPRGLVPGRHVR